MESKQKPTFVVARGPRFDGMPQTFTRDLTLHSDAFRLLAYAMTFHEDWIYRREHMMRSLGWGKDRWNTAIRILKDRGCARQRFDRTPKGKIIGSWLEFSWGQYASEGFEGFTEQDQRHDLIDDLDLIEYPSTKTEPEQKGWASGFDPDGRAYEERALPAWRRSDMNPGEDLETPAGQRRSEWERKNEK